MRVNGLNETITHWAVTDNGLGGMSYALPVQLRGRWEDKNELFRNVAGEEAVSDAIVYLSQDAAIGDWIFRGASVDATPPSGAREIRQFFKSPDLRRLSSIRKAVL